MMVMIGLPSPVLFFGWRMIVVMIVLMVIR